MTCLKCQNEMRYIILKSILVDFCDNCESFWLDDGELKDLLKNKTKTDEEISIEMKKHQKQDLNIKYKHMCQRCGGILKAFYKDDILIEQCCNCKGMFFDKGELETITNKEKNFIKKIISLFI